MTYSISLVDAQPQAAVVIRTRTTPANVPDALGDVLPEVWAFLVEEGVSPTGPPFARYLAYTDDDVDLEAGFPVAQAAEGVGRVTTAKLPGGVLAHTSWRGTGEHPEEAYAAMREHMAREGLEPDGAPWEVYGNSLDDIADPDDWKTEAGRPVKRLA